MLKSILNLNGVELLSKNQLKNTTAGLRVVAECKVWAPPGASVTTYPNYPCAHTIDGPIGERPRVCPEPVIDGIVPIC